MGSRSRCPGYKQTPKGQTSVRKSAPRDFRRQRRLQLRSWTWRLVYDLEQAGWRKKQLEKARKTAEVAARAEKAKKTG